MSQMPMDLPFEKLASYDKPQLLLTQALDNELTLRGGLQTLVDVDGLSPKERDLFTTRLKERIGRNSVTDAAVDVLTNPFVLLMMVTSPAAGSALSRTGKAIFDVAERYSPFVKEQGGLLASLGFLSPTQLFKGTALTPAMEAFTKGVDTMEKEMMASVAEPLRKTLERHGLESLNPDRVKDPVKKALAQKLNDALDASLRGFDREVQDKVIRTRKMVGNEKYDRRKHTKKDWKARGRIEIELKDRVSKRLVSSNMDDVVDRLGLTELRDAFRGAMDRRRMMMFGDEAASKAAGKFVADEKKLLRMWEGTRMGMKESSAFKGTTKELAALAVGPDLAGLVASGRVDQKQFVDALRGMIEGQPTHYMPRNLMDLKGTSNLQQIMEQRRSRSVVATGSSLARTSATGSFDPDDLDRVFKQFGATPDGVKAHLAAQKKVQHVTAKGRAARVYKLNAQESLSRYFRDTGVTHSLYVQTLDDLPRLSQRIKDTRGVALPAKMKVLSEAEARRSPLLGAGKSLASVLQEEHFLLEDRFAKEALETLVRGAVGVQKIEHVATHMALLKGKQGLKWLMDSPVGKTLKASGKWGEGMHKRLTEMADAELGFGEAKSMSGTLAKYFYVTHLGLNLSSVTMNLMQPLLYASVYGGLGNVLKAYGSAFKELGAYTSDRLERYGVRALTDEQHQELIGKHFKFADVDGENLIQIGRDTFSTMDSISYKTQSLQDVSRKESYFFDYPMKLFEKAEWLNRSVAAHSVENLYRSRGIDIRPGSAEYQRMVSDVGEMVGATQFGGSSLNTPMAFQGVGPFGRVGNNPLFRQFLSFPLRSVTTLAYDSPRMADRGFLKGVGQDLVRGMGISAIFYEVGKNTFGADLSPGLFGASLTQAVGGDRFFQSGNEYVPIPPVIDIPVNIVRGALDPGQRQLLQDNLPRLVPGGIAAYRAMGMLPNLMEGPLFGLPGALQKTYVDPKQRTEDGRIAVYKGDGTLIDYQSKGQLFAKFLGVDMGTFRESADFDGFLLKNREQIVEYRRKAIQALLNNEIGKMQGIRSEFKRRYGMELTISKDQLDEAMKNRLVPRTERILDRMPPELRPQYQQLVASRAPELGVEAEAIMGADTARQRMQARQVNALPLGPEQRAVLQEPGFTGFESF
jgi:hypothetical protein